MQEERKYHTYITYVINPVIAVGENQEKRRGSEQDRKNVLTLAGANVIMSNNLDF